MANNDNKYSRFWIDDSLFQSKDSSDIKSDNLDKILRLASYKKAISNFVKIVSNQNIPVKFNSGNESYTDGTTVTISAKMNDKEFDSTVGLSLHEASHIKLSDFKLLSELVKINDVIYTHDNTDMVRKITRWQSDVVELIRMVAIKHNISDRLAARYTIFKLKDI
jgi:hypothetical protein